MGTGAGVGSSGRSEWCMVLTAGGDWDAGAAVLVGVAAVSIGSLFPGVLLAFSTYLRREV